MLTLLRTVSYSLYIPNLKWQEKAIKIIEIKKSIKVKGEQN